MLMIPGPIEIHPDVQAAFSVPPPSHVAPHVIEAFGNALSMTRQAWLASDDSQPFVIAGSGTVAMDMAASNVIEQGDAVLLINTGYFSDRMAEMLRRRGATITELGADFGDAPSAEQAAAALDKQPYKALFATHVDTSTGVRCDAEGLARAANERGVLSVFDGICATAAERFEMAEWGADIYLTASQKAIGLPVGLAMLVASPRALAAHAALKSPPPMSLDFSQWRPIMQAYEERRGSYFSTPATNMLLALQVGLRHVLDAKLGDLTGMQARFAQHQRAADAMRAAWASMGLSPLGKPELVANTLSALCYPQGVEGPALLSAVKEQGVIIAGGLHPARKADYFRVGHMGYTATQPDMLLKTVDAIATALSQCGHATDQTAARQAAATILAE